MSGLEIVAVILLIFIFIAAIKIVSLMLKVAENPVERNLSELEDLLKQANEKISAIRTQVGDND